MDTAVRRRKNVGGRGRLAEAMPAGFTAVDHEKNGRPTVSFRSARGSEASFCERK